MLERPVGVERPAALRQMMVPTFCVPVAMTKVR